MLYLILSPMRTAQTLGLVNKYVFIFNEFAAELISILLLYYIIPHRRQVFYWQIFKEFLI